MLVFKLRHYPFLTEVFTTLCEKRTAPRDSFVKMYYFAIASLGTMRYSLAAFRG